MTSIRFSVSFVAALALTSALFGILRTMIGSQVDVADLKAAARVEFTRLQRDSDVQSRREVKPKLDLPPRAPSTPMVATASAGVGALAPLNPNAARIPGAGSMIGFQKFSARGAGSDRDVIPLVRIEPDYPMRAQERGIEGWVLVGFSITPIGTVKDAVVVDSEPRRVFDDAAIRSVSRWKYNPKIEEGVAVERRGVQVVLRFSLDKKQDTP